MIDLYDEPSALDMPYLGEICSMLASRAPNMSAYVNLYPNYASVAKNTSEQEPDGTFTFPLSENAAVMLISTINEDRG